MAVFDYVGVDAQGKRHKGVLEGESARHVRQLLRDKGWVPLQVSTANEASESSNTSTKPGNTGTYRQPCTIS